MSLSIQIAQTPNIKDALGLLNPRERRFVLQSTLGGLSRTAAAYDSDLKTPPTNRKVLHAISLIEKEMAKELDITPDRVQRIFMDAVEMARSFGDPGNMINGGREMAKLAGLYGDGSGEGGVGRGGTVINIDITRDQMREMSDEELDRYIAVGKRAAIPLGKGDYERKD